MRKWYIPPSNSVPAGPRMVQCHSYTISLSEHVIEDTDTYEDVILKGGRMIVCARVCAQFSGFLQDTLHTWIRMKPGQKIIQNSITDLHYSCCEKRGWPC